MSRRPPNPAAERAAQNQQTIKSLLKLETNKICADCKRNKHPRWASWNLGVFVCIRCSGIHRGMGTHISRVKSVDLDSWTDEQLHSILSWGNARANKYWEAKLAPGHVPSEAKIENFIRTKYELKRWVMDGPLPDPASLDVEGDDDIPLSLVKEKQTIDRKESIRKASVGASGAPAGRRAQAAGGDGGRRDGGSPAATAAAAAAGASAPVIDLIGDPISAPPSSSTPLPRASTAGPTANRVPPKGPPAPPKATNSTKDSLLGLDFLGSQSTAPARPSSTTGVSGGSGGGGGGGAGGGGGVSRPDLKQSILSLYAAAPRVQQQQQQQQQPLSPGFSQGAGGEFVDAFSSLSFSTPPATTSSPKPVDAFSSLSSLTGSASRSPAPVRAASSTSSSAFAGLSGGSFFDTKQAAAPPASAAPPKAAASPFGGLGSLGGGFDAFSSTSPPAAAAAPPPPAAASNAFGDLFDFASSSPAAAAAAPLPTTSTSVSPPPGASASISSVFNLSSPGVQRTKTTSSSFAPAAAAAPAAMAAAAAPPTSPLASVSANWSNADVWANDAWGGADNTAAPPAAAPAVSTFSSSTGLAKAPTNDFGWGTSGTGSSTAGIGGAGGSFASQSIVPGASGGFNPTPKVAADEEFGGWSSGGLPVSGSGNGNGNGNAKPASGFGTSEDLFSNVWD